MGTANVPLYMTYANIKRVDYVIIKADVNGNVCRDHL